MKQQNTPPGPGVDATGQAVIDPTDNVRYDLRQSERRQDDLRETAGRLQEHLANLRFEFLDRLANLRAQHSMEMRRAETERLDAIRSVDQGNVATAAATQTQAAATLAGQVASAADAMRTQVETTRTQLQAQIAATNEPIIKDVAELRKVQYETAGSKAQVVDARELAGGARMGYTFLVVGVVGIVGALVVQQIGALRRQQNQAVGQRQQVAEARAAGSFRTQWVIAMVAILTLGTMAFLSAAAIAVTIILKG